MTLSIFQSIKTPELYGFTVNASGANLPVKDGPWERAGSAISLGTIMASTSPEVCQEIERSGFALVKGHTAPEPHLRKTESTP